MGKLRLCAALKLRDNPLGQHFTQLDAPLIERIDVPDGPLNEDLMFIERDQLAQRLWRQSLCQDSIGRVVALKGAMRYLEVWPAIRLYLFGCLAEGQCLRLGEQVCHEYIVVRAERIQGLAEADKVARNQPGSLMDKLIVSVLPVRPRLPPDDRPGLVVDALALQIDMLAVAFHIKLLKISAEPPQVVIVGQDGYRFRPEEVVIPDANQP